MASRIGTTTTLIPLIVTIAISIAGSVYAEPAAVGTHAQQADLGLTVRIDVGPAVTTEHMHPTGLVGLPPPVSVDLSIQKKLIERFYIDLTFAATFPLGWGVYPNARFALRVTPQTLITVGAGPWFQDLSAVGRGLFGSGDVTAQTTLGSTFILSIGTSLGISLQSKGAPRCGVDTCDAYLLRGDALWILRAGVGFRI
jgi:hypothetical protein